MDWMINFPNLGIYLDHVGKSIDIFGFEIAFYGIVIVLGMLLGMGLALKEAKRLGENPDNYWDMLLFAIIFGIIGARIYYVIFSWSDYRGNILEMINIRHGGLAIYGGIIGGSITVYLFTRWKGMDFLKVVDCLAPGLLVGQIIGRWGNFFKREAFGNYSNGLLAMQLPVSAVRQHEITRTMWEHMEAVKGVAMIQVHPTFLYEGAWNFAALLLVWFYRKRKKFNGELFLLYLAAYGLGRVWIEGLRTDQLLLPVLGLPVSQILSGLLLVAAAGIILWKRWLIKKTGENPIV